MEVAFAALVARAERAPLAASHVPPPRFASASFSSYQPDPDYPSQVAVAARLSRRARPWERRALYVDGPFGVGKTHLLAAAYHGAAGPKAFLAFPDLVLTLIQRGVEASAKELRGHRLLCVDEFELDDPGTLQLVLGFLNRLIAFPRRTRVLATSTTAPSQLGLGRLDTTRFHAELAALADVFEVLRLEGRDHRQIAQRVLPRPGPTVEVDHVDLTAHLAALHPLRYAALVAPLGELTVHALRPIAQEADGLRFVHFVDKLYDFDARLRAPDGCALPTLFDATYATGAFAAKFGRCRSRLSELIG